ncbi:unnamed protein product (macronuclear) [Paramecium tetraurelia]|uniref:Uncharacterized protein n=1 Tax=Paramecium tetraurelia TaxID=5888 RepID=A0EIK3_PARTE|nr:uncharacterized protein GSPATT00027473001 [Paramecium tetraurelia]CAK95144.1 unnamed protein product [Paramecium tetraurelia]|eukprot:XP_001462517.1 hypothetical protein (macronuclear) [Paramecium tetraurelia strain d4-2]
MSEELVRLQTIEFKQEIEKRFAKSRHNHNYVFEREGNDFSDDDSLDSLRNIGLYNLCKPIRNKSMETERTVPKTSKTLLIRLLKPKKQPSVNENRSNNTSLYKSRSQSKNGTTRLRTEYYVLFLIRGSVLRESKNITLISPKIPKSPLYIQVDNLIKSAKNQHLYKLNNYSMAV